MPRLDPFGWICAGFLFLSSADCLSADPPSADPEAAFQNTLLVQRAMEQARHCLYHEGNAKKAVEILEGQLPRINGNAVYLRLLRDAYRSYIRDLHLARQTSAAQKYLARLSILDREAAADPSLRPVANRTQAIAKAPAQSAANVLTKGVSAVKQLLPGSGRLLPQGGVTTATVRAKIEDDPFDLAYKHSAPSTADRSRAVQLLAKADAKYSERRFAEARALYDQAYQADRCAGVEAFPRWAYCKLNGVVEQINQANFDPATAPQLEQDVEAAMAMAPALSETGKWLLTEINQRRGPRPTVTGTTTNLQVTVQHGRDAQGWNVAETAHFRIHHQQSRALAERAARVAERTRLAMFQKWFGNDGLEWTPKCDVYLHATGRDYQRLTGVPSATPGHANIQSDKTTGKVVGRRIDLHCDVPNMLDAVLPHETTHVVLAGQFGPQPLPRWADEGMAVLTEPAEQIAQHRSNLARSLREANLFSVRALMQLNDWPDSRRMATFYAQSVHVVEYLTRQRGARVFTEFLRDGLHRGYEQALRKHYGWRDFNELQGRWQQQLAADVSQVDPRYAGR